MKTNYWNKDKKNSGLKKKNNNWNQSLKSVNKVSTRPTKLKKSLQYIFLLRKFKNVVDFKNVKLLKAFLTKYGKIRPRRKTRITVQKQRRISKAIRKARAMGIIPFTCDLKI
jgi:small subunit ribosomal protein S18